LNKPLT